LDEWLLIELLQPYNPHDCGMIANTMHVHAKLRINNCEHEEINIDHVFHLAGMV
jgi:hypothetical protein